MYKNYNMTQLTLPMETEILIPNNDIAHAVNQIVETIPETEFYEFNHLNGASSYHPKMMLKVILYAYTQSIFSGRRIEAALSDSIRMMWLSQNQKPSYRTINRFRVNPIMDKLLKSLFVNFRTQLIEQKLIDNESIFIDGTKIEANANKYTFVWRKNTERYNQNVIDKSKSLYEELIQTEILPELKLEMNEEMSNQDLKEVCTELENKIEDLSKTIKTDSNIENRKSLGLKKSNLKKYKKELNEIIEHKSKYQVQLRTFGDRNSYSKTDNDATFMRMKDDHMRNGQLKAGYNLQIATNHQFILSFNVYQNPTDTRTLIPFLEHIKNYYGDIPEYIVADAGYGSEPNYLSILDDFGKTPLITYGMFIKEQKKKYKNDKFNTQNWAYDEINDELICPNNRRLPFIRYAYRKDKYGFRRDFKLYESDSCNGCLLRNQCIKNNSLSNKKVMKNYNWEYFKFQINKKLSEPKTQKIYSQRKIDVEPVFGFLKAILGFKRMSLRGLPKVKREVGLALMAINIRKIVAHRAIKMDKNIKMVVSTLFHVETTIFLVI
ncbi:IS1182 family transposase [Staphylococcus sp. FSL K6-3157]|uniref:IS1182 family transposase n=1 Tax=Staphylococcus sp. FSL K6-3157 TaxID=2921490 RepID=UPI0030F597CE